MLCFLYHIIKIYCKKDKNAKTIRVKLEISVRQKSYLCFQTLKKEMLCCLHGNISYKNSKYYNFFMNGRTDFFLCFFYILPNCNWNQLTKSIRKV